MAPERITGQSYTITSDVWSLGVTLLEVAQHRFPFPADGTEMQPRAGLIDLLTYIVRQPIPKLKDEPENKVRWSDNFKYFIECWYVLDSHMCIMATTANYFLPVKSRERTTSKSNAVADAGTSLDAGHQKQESEHGRLPEASMGLDRLEQRNEESNAHHLLVYTNNMVPGNKWAQLYHTRPVQIGLFGLLSF